ncbi:hypothetical protein BKA62DRAFT_689504 [Auriculariales sp. MPI-PUGE-AT-0066]|nr:hypothetical protein BKA62DRAFT_689504 [Auriculariales sp. MPI-PUGE-AT-0066]
MRPADALPHCCPFYFHLHLGIPPNPFAMSLLYIYTLFFFFYSALCAQHCTMRSRINSTGSSKKLASDCRGVLDCNCSACAKEEAKATYMLHTTHSYFDIDYTTKQVTLSGMSTVGNTKGSAISLSGDASNGGYLNWVIAGNNETSLISSNPPQAWIQHVLPTFGDKPLREFILPGSHDAGMSILNGTTLASKECKTLTQSGSILSQLQTGFDIRPVISAGIFKAGHLLRLIGDFPSLCSGGNGEKLDDIVNDINTFTPGKAEIIVLRLSHDLNTDVGNANYRPFNKDEVARLFALLNNIKDLYVSPSPTVDLSALTLNQLTGNGKRSAVIIQLRLDSTEVNLTAAGLQGKGFFNYDQLPAYNEFSDSNDLDDMMEDQFAKMKEQRAQNAYFMLSFTLTQSALNTASCPYLADSIIQMAAPARKALYTNLLPAVSGNTYPQMMQIDDFSSAKDIVPLVLAVAYKVHAGL